MKILGLDLGSKTLGIASSDLSQTVASMVKTITFPENQFKRAINELKSLIDFSVYEKIVLGLPKNMDGSLGKQAEDTLVFKKMLENHFHLEVVMWDERLTSKMANSMMITADLSRKKRKQKVDYVAATIILQSYLDSRK
ncbi:MAG: Holliday junction resolvase RuvX [Candidatus Izemoplasmatales bacterium]|uniref:Putative pre-16S rRNA nuclease n=1 Tax=Hujiaoplasma nucleasis TaxID=2725268 RepID=A0A7L6MZN6_9MOLU|nr:Holliday junction resolvase RuvX [Hujiaoplasma nucleasis]QLY39453.1 Holliday junction resolvase RuvX [Hujiaoplasma nucleasis]